MSAEAWGDEAHVSSSPAAKSCAAKMKMRIWDPTSTFFAVQFELHVHTRTQHAIHRKHTLTDWEADDLQLHVGPYKYTPAAVVDEACNVSVPGGIDDLICVQSKEVATYPVRFIVPLTYIRYRPPHDLAHVFHQQLPCRDRL